MTSISKKVHIDKLDDIFNKYNNTYHSTIKMKPFEVKLNTYIDSVKKLMIKIRNLKLVIILEYQNIKMFLQKNYTPNWSEEVPWTYHVPWTYVINDVNSEEIVGTFYENELQKSSQKEKLKKLNK